VLNRVHTTYPGYNLVLGEHHLAEGIFLERYEFTTPSPTWNIVHHLGKEVVCRFFDSAFQELYPNSLVLTVNNSVATFSSPQAGTVFVIDIVGSSVPTYHHIQGAAATTWTISHGLGQQFADVAVYDNADTLLFPNAIRVMGPDTLEIDFAGAQDGYAFIF